MVTLIPPKTNIIYYLLFPALIAMCAGFTIGLTFAPCYSSMCVEQFLPFQARLHIALYYTLLATIAFFLTLQSLSPTLHKLSTRCIFSRGLPLVGARLTVGGILLTVWIMMLSFGSIGYWQPAEYAWWDARGAVVNFSSGLHQVAWTGITGHWLDIWIGLVIIPVSRNSILGKTFRLHVSTLLLFHQLLAYALFVGSVVHGVLYYIFVAGTASAPAAVTDQFPVDNPTMSATEAKANIPRGYLVLPTGVIAFILILAVVITSLPQVRRKNYNVFYFTHVTFAVGILVLTCLHASTNFYFLLPGILLWVGDWVWRLRHSLRKSVEIEAENAGNGWYRLRLPGNHTDSDASLEKAAGYNTTAASAYPLATYYLNIPSVSKLQVHPFTAAAAESPATGPVLLSRQAAERKSVKKSDREWTRKLANAVDGGSEKAMTVKARIEGPYNTVVPEMYTAEHILLLVGGSGITGALSIANWWAWHFASATSQERSLRLVWTVRSPEEAQVHEVQQLQAVMDMNANMDFVVHFSSKAGRLSCADELGKMTGSDGRQGRVWVYGSGPDRLLADLEDACYVERTRLGRERKGLEEGVKIELSWYMARWSR